MRLRLSFNNEFHRYVVCDPYMTSCDRASYEMVIEQPYSGEYRYRFIIWVDGDWAEMITEADLKERLQDIEDHEGAEVAKIWSVNHPYHVVKHHRVFALQQKWEALVEIGLSIPVTFDSWQSKPIEQGARDAMAEARDRYMMQG